MRISMSIQHEHADDVLSYEDIEGSVYLRAGHLQVVYEVEITLTALVTKVMCSSSRFGRWLTCNREDQGRSGEISCSRWSQSEGVTDLEEGLHDVVAHDGFSAHLVAGEVPEEG